MTSARLLTLCRTVSTSVTPPFRGGHYAAFCLKGSLTNQTIRRLSTQPNESPPARIPLSTSDVGEHQAIETGLNSGDTMSQISGDYIQAFHESLSPETSLPWNITIPLLSLTVRTLVLPLMYYNELHRGRALLVQKELGAIQSFVRKSPGNLGQKYMTFRRLRELSLKSAGTSSLRMFPWQVAAYMPMVIGSSIGLREVARRMPEAWSESGIAWIGDLSAADATGVLPVLTTGLWLWNLRGARTKGIGSTKEGNEGEEKVERRKKAVEVVMEGFGNSLRRVLQVVCVVSLNMTMELPAGIVLFWAGNGVLGMGITACLQKEGVRRWLGLVTKEDVEQSRGAGVLRGTKVAVENARKELNYVQREIAEGFQGRRVDEKLRADVQRLLKRERWNRRIGIDLSAVIREDERDGKKYVAIVRKGSESSE